jgi:voltage-gated potassium channel Kch
MGYIKFDRNQANEGDSLLLPLEGIITVKSSGATAAEIKYNTVVHTDATAPEVLSHALTVEAKSGVTLTRDLIVNNIIAAIENAGENGPNVAVAGMNVTAQTIAGATL